MKTNNDSRFDIDLRYGQNIENKLIAALEGTIEVKAERDLWLKTGNIAIEYECRGKPSGIAVTESDYWAQALVVENEPQVYILWPIDSIKRIAREYVRMGKVVMGGDDNTAKMFLIPLKEILLK